MFHQKYAYTILDYAMKEGLQSDFAEDRFRTDAIIGKPENTGLTELDWKAIHEEWFSLTDRQQEESMEFFREATRGNSEFLKEYQKSRKE